ncbi:TIGR02391 family protein [Sphingorhabdus sp. YGSMI21]|uniref:TIGR02391 family protein n=1 Tax=Sphingorhabdus sp. YGSMI21 TaxID=2077182 RepID=UPI000C1F31EA|nr:TIGR02391 family protein [Sphingorhabdus sp. YGSMI21]ATW02118.1 TIGR02391 family protein [Sphingorhabdus sp. YGSMI21]
MKLFTQAELEAIASALGDTVEGLTNPEIELLIRSAKMIDPGKMTKRHRIYNAFAESQNSKRNRTHVLEFIRLAMSPARYSREPARYEPMRAALNQALAFAGVLVAETGVLRTVSSATTLPEAQRRAQNLRADLEGRGVHPDVLAFCRAELLVDNYFHAVQEAVKSVADKVRSKTGLIDDGGTLIDRAFGGNPPLLAINARRTVSEKSEQSGFANLVKGAFGMFRNPTAHEARIRWEMSKADAEDLLTIVSLIHRRLDASNMPPRV